MIYEQNAFPAHFWLISAQEQFALVALAAVVMFDAKRLEMVLKAAVVLGVVGRIIGCLLWMPDHPALATENPFAIADAMALGMLCRLAVVGGQSKTRLRREIILGGLITAVLWATVPNTYASYFGLVPFMTALAGCYFILMLSDDVRSRRLQRGPLGSPILVGLGQMSLSLFLLHPLVNTLINLGYARWTGSLMPWWMLIMAGPPLSIAVAYGYFRSVEVPIRRFRGGPKNALSMLTQNPVGKSTSGSSAKSHAPAPAENSIRLGLSTAGHSGGNG
jgi:peptidoglycan/LPS O-acetylase OafA/YrhL